MASVHGAPIYAISTLIGGYTGPLANIAIQAVIACVGCVALNGVVWEWMHSGVACETEPEGLRPNGVHNPVLSEETINEFNDFQNKQG